MSILKRDPLNNLIVIKMTVGIVIKYHNKVVKYLNFNNLNYMRKENGYIFWLKTEKIPLNEYFNTSEFTCQCKHDDCKEQQISIELVDKLTELREEMGSPLKITSGYRCSKHQEDIRNSGVSTVVAKKSSHELGNAADIKSKKHTPTQLQALAEKHFKAIGLAKTFIHVDLRKDKVRRWNY